MTFKEIRKQIKDIPTCTPEDGRFLYEFVQQSNINDILELGTHHGSSACYMAAALQEKGSGSVVTIDLKSARELSPGIIGLRKSTGLRAFIQPVFADSSYTWELKRLIEQQQSPQGQTNPLFDFCYLDGAHSWETDGMAFFLVEKLLKPGGWILFDDIDWSYGNSPSLKETDFVKAMPAEERDSAQVERIFSLLVKQHPAFDYFREEKRWAWARKRLSEDIPEIATPELLQTLYEQQGGLLAEATGLLRKIKKRLRK